jgi:glycosyltransferase involved in cell wall biosynthesis
MRILFFSHRSWPALGGVESFLRHLAYGLSERHEVTVLALRTDSGLVDRLTTSVRAPAAFEPFQDGPVRVEPLRIRGREKALLAPLATQVVPVLRRYAFGRARVPASRFYGSVVGPLIERHARDADVLHAFSNDILAEACVHAARAADVPCLITPFAHAKQYGTGPADVAAYRKSDCVVALLDEEASLYRGLGVPADRIRVTRVASPGVPPGHGDEVRERYRLRGPIVLFLGVRRPYKGFQLLLEASGRVAARRQDVTFVFAGPGERVQHGEHVLDVGEVDEEGRAGWLEAADLLCLPSEAEIFPGSFLEAWSVGTPVLASDIPTLRELVTVSQGGVAVRRDPASVAEAIVGLLAEPERLRLLGETGRRFWHDECTVEAVSRWHEELYSSLVPPAGVGGALVASHV